jgi:hypothetical protein
MQPILRNAWVAFAGLIGSGLASAALVVAPLDGVTVTKEMLAANLLGAGSGITITNVAYTGANGMAGTFAGGGGILGIASGILLTSGSVFNVVGPNQSPGITTIADVPGDPDLTVLAGDETYDASVLTITFVPTGNQVRFSYVFASEEYNEFIDQYNDVFGFFVNGVNRALVPGATLPVAINNINCGETGAGTGPNCNLFVDNTAGTLDTEFDGLTKVLTLTAAVTPNVPNTLKIAIADTGDSILDSAVFIAAESFSVCGATGQPPCANYQGLWWKSPASSESGWGVNLAHQGNTIFATWFTYDLAGKPWWLAVVANLVSPGVYSGDLFTTTGPPFNAVPFNPATVVETTVGTATFTFTDDSNGTFAYTVNTAAPAKAVVTQTKNITRQLFATPVPSCTWGGQPNLALATNYQDLWWKTPASSESGWGINFTHQGNTIFATWFTYDLNGKPWWLAFVADRTAPGVYAGNVFTTTGPPFNAVPFNSASVVETTVGTTTLTFTDGNSGTFAYTVNGVSQTKPITRQVFVQPGTVCQ